MLSVAFGAAGYETAASWVVGLTGVKAAVAVSEKTRVDRSNVLLALLRQLNWRAHAQVGTH